MKYPDRFVIYNRDITVFLGSQVMGHYSRSCPVDANKTYLTGAQHLIDSYYGHRYLCLSMPVHDYRD